MPATGLKQKSIWLEVYDERFKEDSEDSIMEIWVSVE
jgi:predicted transcriptional regulator YdeE